MAATLLFFLPMSESKIGKPLILFALAFCLALLSSPSLSFSLTEEIVPKKKIELVAETSAIPKWRQSWDKARALTRQGDLAGAAELYDRLFRTKPQLEEIVWEYCKLLVRLGDDVKLDQVLQRLLEIGSAKNEYLLVAAEMAARQKKYRQAARFFGGILENEPGGEFSDKALRGLAISLEELGEIRAAIPLLLQYHIRFPNDLDVVHRLARGYLAMKKNSSARFHYKLLLAEDYPKKDIFLEAIEAYSDTDFKKNLAPLYQRYLSQNSDDVEIRKEYIDLLEKEKLGHQALEQLDLLLALDPENPDYLLAAGELAKDLLNRPDKTLYYFFLYLELRPNDQAMAERITAIEEGLASDLLVLVENDGAELLWQDLLAIKKSREAIFFEMAELLHQQKKFLRELLLLEFLYEKIDHKQSLVKRLVNLSYDLGFLEKALEYQRLVADSSKKHFLFTAKLESELWLEKDALSSLAKALALDPEDKKLRFRSLLLAGRLGLAKRQIELFSYWMDKKEAPVSPGIVAHHLDLLGYNFQLAEIEKVMAWAREHPHYKPKERIPFELIAAKALHRGGQQPAAEQGLRKLINDRIWSDRIAESILAARLDSDNVFGAKEWLESFLADRFFGERYYSQALKKVLDSYYQGRYYQQLGWLKDAEKEFKAAEDALAGVSPKEVGYGRVSDGLYLYWSKLLIDQQQNASAVALLKKLGDDHNRGAALALRNTVSRLPEDVLFYQENKDSHKKARPKTTVLLSLIDQEIFFGRYQSARTHLALLEKKKDLSPLALFFISDPRLSSSIAKRQEGLQQLYQEFPGEYTVCMPLARLFAKQRQEEKVMEVLAECDGLSPAPTNLVETLLAKDGFESVLILTRLAWRGGRQQEAIDLYNRILVPSIIDILTAELETKRLEFRQLVGEGSFWDSMLWLLQSDPDLLDEVMTPDYLLSNAGTVQARMVADHYLLYYWKNTVEQEYLARQAIFERRYRVAQMNYEKLLEEKGATEVMVDLASVYGRMGEFRKEAQMYEELAGKGEGISELEDSIQRSETQLRPRSSVSIDLGWASGRDGLIDLDTVSLATDFWTIHDLNKELRFAYAFNTYDSDEEQDSLRANWFGFEAGFDLGRQTFLTAGLSNEIFLDGDGSQFSFLTRLDYSFNEYVSGSLKVAKTPVLDNVATILQHIDRDEYTVGMVFDTEQGVRFGGDFTYKDYSDGNSQERLYGFVNYLIFGETIRFDLKYDYEYFSNRLTNTPEFSAAPATESEIPYWSPANYTLHRAAAQFRHDFLGYEQDQEQKMSYYSTELFLGYEDDKTMVYGMLFDIFLEITPHFLLKGNFGLNTSEVYEEFGTYFSLQYRW